jgi:hypothetical protein
MHGAGRQRSIGIHYCVLLLASRRSERASLALPETWQRPLSIRVLPSSSDAAPRGRPWPTAACVILTRAEPDASICTTLHDNGQREAPVWGIPGPDRSPVQGVGSTGRQHPEGGLRCHEVQDTGTGAARVGTGEQALPGPRRAQHRPAYQGRTKADRSGSARWAEWRADQR